MNKISGYTRSGDKKLNVMFGDLSYYNRHTLLSRYTPLGIGLITQYAYQQFGNDIKVSLFKNVDKFFAEAKENPPDVVGLSVYYWNMALNQYVVKRLRQMFNRDVIIVLGGPSIDSDLSEQHKFLTETFPTVDALIVNEGELGFSNILRKIIGNRKLAFSEPIDGASFLNQEGKITVGRPIGTTMDLSTMGSPYLSGLMDEFMHSDYQPLIQTSRFCPYTCAFCVSGKNRGKLRGYPIEQVKEELRYVSKNYADRPHHIMYMADENFGILKRDVEIAEEIKKCRKDFNFPQNVFFYNDKRFTETSRAVIQVLGDINKWGMTLALQTENPETLKAINRRNVSEEEIDSAIRWASNLNIPTATELIFGMPYETRDGFVDLLNRSIKRGFDSVLCNNLFVMDGIELNRPDSRKKFKLKTKYRILGTNYGSHEGNFFAEYEEVVVGSDTFTYEEFLEVRSLNFMFYAVFSLNFQRWFFQFIRYQEISLTDFFSRFFKPDRKVNWPKEYLTFLDDFREKVEGELHNSPEEVVNKCKKIYETNDKDVGEPGRINVNLGARLIYQESEWIKSVLMHHLNDMMQGNLSEEDSNLANTLINLAKHERIDLRNINKKNKKENLDLSFDVINWRKSKFKKSIKNFRMPLKSIKFIIDENREFVINSFKKKFDSAVDKDFYYAAISHVQPKSNLLHILAYDDKKVLDKELAV